MGRLNYTNRKTEGLKLGQSIARDLIKRIPPGTGSKSALRDPVIELDVTGKFLGEDGFQEVADALERSLEYAGDNGRVVQLEELCLKANKLDASCLPALARVVRLAAYELRDLDLSDNHFTITSSQDANAWEDFLESFAGCCVLRRIDLSSNALGSKAFEVMTRVYSREPVIGLLLEEGRGITLQGDTPSRRGTIGDTESLHRQTRNLSLVSASDTYSDDDEDDERTSVQDWKVAQGNEHGMTDVGALHLSYVIDCHHLPDRLLKQVPPARPGHQVQLLDAYDNETGCQGIIYLPNEGFSSPGLRILELCEAARQSLLDDDRPAKSKEYSQTHFRKTSLSRKTSVTQSSPFTPASGSRRRSGTKGEHEELTDSDAIHAELDRARSRIQGNTLKETGVQSNDLWRIALNMLNTCRMFCPPRIEEADVSKPEEETLRPLQPVKNPEFPTLPKARSKPFVGYLDPWAPALAAKSPNLPITPQGKKQPLKIKTTTPSPHSIATTPPTAVSPKTGTLQTKLYRSNLPHGLHEEMWACILGQCLGADRYMSRRQQCSVLRWATDRRTLAKEMESLGKPESAQIWKVLEGTGCLAYEDDDA
ncbi:MAG: hypothetical protein Q9166_001313 [cf. Caloplaca sp. 2 TL-2023]